MAAIVRSVCDTFDEVKKEYLPKVSSNLILDARRAEKTKPSLSIVNIKYKEGTNFKEKCKGISDKGYKTIDRKEENIFIQVQIPLTMETLFELSKDEDIKSIRKATWVP